MWCDVPGINHSLIIFATFAAYWDTSPLPSGRCYPNFAHVFLPYSAILWLVLHTYAHRFSSEAFPNKGDSIFFAGCQYSLTWLAVSVLSSWLSCTEKSARSCTVYGGIDCFKSGIHVSENERLWANLQSIFLRSRYVPAPNSGGTAREEGSDFLACSGKVCTVNGMGLLGGKFVKDKDVGCWLHFLASRWDLAMQLWIDEGEWTHRRS